MLATTPTTTAILIVTRRTRRLCRLRRSLSLHSLRVLLVIGAARLELDSWCRGGVGYEDRSDFLIFSRFVVWEEGREGVANNRRKLGRRETAAKKRCE